MNSINHLFNITQKFSPFLAQNINDDRKIYKTIDSHLFDPVIHSKHKRPVPSKTKSNNMKRTNSDSFQLKTMEITYKRNRYGNFQIHCPYHVFPAFIYDQCYKAIVGVQVESEIRRLNNREKRICDAWNLHYIDNTFNDAPPPYEFDSHTEPVINKPLPTAPEIEPLVDKSSPSAPEIEEFLYRVHEDPLILHR